MKINTDKTIVISFTRNDPEDIVIQPYCFNSIVLPRDRVVKVLGIYLDEKLKWLEQVSEVSKHASRILRYSQRILRGAPREILSATYSVLVRPLLEYCSSVWDPYLQCQIDQLEMIQRRAIR